MKAIKSLIPVLAAGFLAGGCYYSHPLQVRQPSAFNGTTVAAGTIGAAGGAFAGNAINKQVGAPVGAAVGALAAGGTAYVLQDRKAREIQEAYEDGEREGRAQVLDEWWSENAVLDDPGGPSGQDHKKGPRTRQIPLPAGIYESVPYHSRSYEYMVRP
jgi:hypothetical protein